MSSREKNSGVRLPVDHELRERLASDFTRSYIVDAGAGTGKTTVLVSRVIGAVDAGIKMSRIAAITFTEKAAGELMMRVRGRIDEKLAEGAGDVAKWREARGQIELASIGTIHSFCADLIRKRPVEAGVSPTFKVMDNTESALFLDGLWRKWIREKIDAGDPYLRKTLAAGLSLKNLKEGAFALVEKREFLDKTESEKIAGIDYAEFVKKYKELLSKAEKVGCACMKPDDDNLFTRLPAFRKRLDRIVKNHESYGCLIVGHEIPRLHLGRKNDWKPREAIEEFRKILKEINRHCELVNNANAEALINWLGGFVLYCEEEKRREGLMDFNDLLIHAARLLREGGKELRASLQGEYDLILVDEFQDTDPLQVETAFLLAAADGSVADWKRADPADGRLFIVGDPKQSIYRFRRADIAVYRSVRDGIGNLEKESLKQNFRSAKPLVDWFNDFFENIFDPKGGGSFQAGYTRIEPPPAYVAPPTDASRPGAWSLTVPGLSVGDKRFSAQMIRTMEAAAVASALDRIRREGWLVRDGATGEWRPVEWRDMVILFRTRTGLPYFNGALSDRGIPYATPGRGGLFQQPEIRGLISALTAIERPDDGPALVGALRSSLFGFSVEELLAAAKNGVKFDYTLENHFDDQAGRLRAAFRIMGNLHDCRNGLPASRVVTELLDKTGTLAAYSTSPMFGERVSNISRFVELARRFDSDGGGTFAEFLDHVFVAESQGDIEESSGVDPDGDGGLDAVRLMTIHGAKGLEFPVVVLGDMAGMVGSRVDPVLVDRTARRVFVNIGDFKSADFNNIKEREKAEQKLEEERLLYVACTRARDYLVIPVPEEGVVNGLTRKAVEYVKDAGRELTHHFDVADLDDGNRESKADAMIRLIERVESSKDGPDSPEKILEKRDEIVRDAARPDRYGTVTDEIRGGEYYERTACGARGSWTELGRFVHKLLEMADLSDPASVERTAESVAENFGLEEGEQAIGIAMAGRALGTDIVSKALSSGVFKREVPFVVEKEKGGTTSGTIDLIYEGEGGYVIVDYKTDNVKDENEARERVDKTHAEQGRLYAGAIEKITGVKVAEVVFLFLRPDPPIAVSIK